MVRLESKWYRWYLDRWKKNSRKVTEENEKVFNEEKIYQENGIELDGEDIKLKNGKNNNMDNAKFYKFIIPLYEYKRKYYTQFDTKLKTDKCSGTVYLF